MFAFWTEKRYFFQDGGKNLSKINEKMMLFTDFHHWHGLQFLRVWVPLNITLPIWHELDLIRNWHVSIYIISWMGHVLQCFFPTLHDQHKSIRLPHSLHNHIPVTQQLDYVTLKRVWSPLSLDMSHTEILSYSEIKSRSTASRPLSPYAHWLPTHNFGWIIAKSWINQGRIRQVWL